MPYLIELDLEIDGDERFAEEQRDRLKDVVEREFKVVLLARDVRIVPRTEHLIRIAGSIYPGVSGQ